METKKPLKIVGLQAENVKKLVAVEIKPNGAVVELTGRNGQGKTSVLDSIWWALAGTASIQGAPIRKGAAEARIRLDMGEIVITRKFKAKEDGEYTSSLTVENAEGARFSSPQAMLDGLLGALSFDPLAFARMDARKQYDTLRALVPGIDFAEIERLNKADYDSRTALNRKSKDLTAQAGPLDASAPTERVDETGLLAQMEQAAKTNAEIEERKGRRLRAADEIQGLKVDAKNLRDRAAQMIAEAESYEERAKDLQHKLDTAEPLPEPTDVSALRAQVEQARAVNAKVEARERRQRLLREAEEAHQQAERLTGLMEQREKDKQAAIAAAKLPVAGMGFGDGLILLNGLPFDQASDAEQLRASIAIAMALNPRLRVIRVRDGSLLDEDSMKLLAEMAEARDYQVWVERVDGSGKVGFVLEDGHVRAAAEAVAA